MDRLTKTELRKEIFRLTKIWMGMMPLDIACLDCGVVRATPQDPCACPFKVKGGS